MINNKANALCGLLICLIITHPSGAFDAPGAGDRPKWELIFEDNFTRTELGEQWQVLDGDWSIVDNSLVGSGFITITTGFPGTDPHRVLPGEDPPGFIRMEIEARSIVRPAILLPGGQTPEVYPCDLSAFIHGQKFADGERIALSKMGYFFQFGRANNTENRIWRNGDEIASDLNPSTRIVPGKLHRIIVENDNGTLRLTVDGEVILEHNEKLSIISHDQDRVGLYFDTQTAVDNVKVYVNRLQDGYF